MLNSLVVSCQCPPISEKYFKEQARLTAYEPHVDMSMAISETSVPLLGPSSAYPFSRRAGSTNELRDRTISSGPSNITFSLIVSAGESQPSLWPLRCRSKLPSTL